MCKSENVVKDMKQEVHAARHHSASLCIVRQPRRCRCVVTNRSAVFLTAAAGFGAVAVTADAAAASASTGETPVLSPSPILPGDNWQWSKH